MPFLLRMWFGDLALLPLITIIVPLSTDYLRLNGRSSLREQIHIHEPSAALREARGTSHSVRLSLSFILPGLNELMLQSNAINLTIMHRPRQTFSESLIVDQRKAIA